MSVKATEAITLTVLNSVKNALQTFLPDPPIDAYVALTEGGDPPPTAGEWFVGIHKDPTSTNQPQPGGRTTYTDESYTQLITFSMRVTRYASDRVARDGYSVLQDKIRIVACYFLNNMEAIRAAINAQLDLASTDGFLEPFNVPNMSPNVQKRGKSWFKAARSARTSGQGGTQGQGTLAVSATLRLEGLRRIQIIGGVN